MSNKENVDALQLGPRKKPRSTDPLVHHGRHFGRTIHALCNIQALINNGIVRMGERADEPEESFTSQERREHRVFLELLRCIPGLEERLMSTESEEEVHAIAVMLQKGASSARSDDTKSLKSAIIDWLTAPGEALIPPISRNVKNQSPGLIMRLLVHSYAQPGLIGQTKSEYDCQRIKDKLRTGELSVAGDQWPIFLYNSYKYDENDPWKGLLQSSLLVKTFKHIFTSPSSVEREAKATRSGNARIHGMTSVTRASIAYAAVQARFALCSSNVFNRNDTTTDSERFYNSILELLEHPDETAEVDRLLAWWNRHVFPNYTPQSRPVSKNSVLAKIKAKREAAKRAALAAEGSTT